MTEQGQQAVEEATGSSGMCPIDFDHHSLEYANTAHEMYREIRENGGVARSEQYGGFYVFTRYDDITTLARDWETYSSDRDQNGPGSGGGGGSIPANPASRASLLEMDPPEWRRVRTALSKALAPGAVQRRMPRIQYFADLCVDRIIEKGRGDLALDVSMPIPALLTLDIFGFPLDEWERYAEPFHKMVYLRRDHPEFAEAMEGLQWVMDQIRARIALLRRTPGDDLLSELMRHPGDGRPFDDQELEEMMFTLFAGGIDTTTALMSNAFAYLAEHPDERAKLREHPELLEAATEEFLRVVSPVQNLARTVTHTVEFDGVEMHRGDRVLLSWASANRDPEQFENPDEVILDRFPNRHCAFGMGIHRCLGSNLARAQFQVVVQTVLRRMPDYRVVAGARRYPRLGTINGYECLPVEFTPGRPLTDPLTAAIS